MFSSGGQDIHRYVQIESVDESHGDFTRHTPAFTIGIQAADRMPEYSREELISGLDQEWREKTFQLFARVTGRVEAARRG